MAFIETSTTHGSGVLVEGGYIVTNAHVVWPDDAVRVVFPNGETFPRVPVTGLDAMIDLAVIGPIATDIPGLRLADGEHLPLGSDVLLIGYPGESDARRNPQPTVVRGVLSRYREVVGITFLQADAAIAGGQSGGALVSAHGELIGISGQSYTDAQFSLSASAADVAPYVGQLAAGQETSGLGDRSLRRSDGMAGHTLVDSELNAWRGFMVEARGPVTLRVSGSAAGGAAAYDAYGQQWLRLEKDAGGEESGSFDYSGPVFVVAWTLGERGARMEVRSSSVLIPLPDDDGRLLSIGQTAVGNIDFPNDVDIFPIRLAAGETVEVTARSALIDPELHVYQNGGAYAYDDNSGGGSYGIDAQIVWRAPHAGTFYVRVGTESAAPGGYTLTVLRAAGSAALTHVVRPTATPVPTPTQVAAPADPVEWVIARDGVSLVARWTGKWSAAADDFVTQPTSAVLYVLCSPGDASLARGIHLWVVWGQPVVETVTSVGHIDGADEDVQIEEWLRTVDGVSSIHPDGASLFAWLLTQRGEVLIYSHGSDIAASFYVTGLRAAVMEVDYWTCGL